MFDQFVDFILDYFFMVIVVILAILCTLAAGL